MHENRRSCVVAIGKTAPVQSFTMQLVSECSADQLNTITHLDTFILVILEFSSLQFSSNTMQQRILEILGEYSVGNQPLFTC